MATSTQAPCDRPSAAAAGGTSCGDVAPVRAPFFGWPGWRLLLRSLALGAAITLWFGFVYGGADWITAQRTLRVRVDLPIEQAMPFVPAAVLFYMSIYPLFWMAPFVLRSRQELDALVATLAAVILMAGVCFLILPAELAYTSHRDWGPWAGWFAVADRMNLRYNLLPSLHVALSIVCVRAYADHATWVVQVLLWSWGATIALSTLLTHEHHVLDAVTGWLLALAAVRFVYRRRLVNS